MQFGWPLPKRKEFIERLNRQPLARVHTVYFQGRRQDLAIHNIPIEFPKYRLDNGRTRSAQATYLARHPELPADFFRADAESEAAQKAQHEILKSMLGSGEKDLIRFFKSRDQMQPFILTELGFVLNGNRRLCSFRELMALNKEEYESRFGNIEVIILPPADERELDRLEAVYQLTEDIKEAYSWTARAYMLRTRQQEHHFDVRELSAIYQISPTEVGDLLSMLSLAEEYLEDQGKANQYELVDDDEFAFRQLLKTRGKKRSEADKAVLQELSFCVIQSWTFGRLYSVIPKIGEHLDEIQKAIQDEFPTPPETKESKAALLLGVKSVTVDPISKILEDPKNRTVVREIISDVLDSAEERDRERRKGGRVLSRLSKAQEHLLAALNNWTTTKDLAALRAKIEEIEKTLMGLRGKLDAPSKN